MDMKIFKPGNKINNHEVVIMDDLRDQFPEMFIESGQMNWKLFEEKIRPNYSIYIRHDKNTISFTMGENACNILDLLTVVNVFLKTRTDKTKLEKRARSLILGAMSLLREQEKEDEQARLELEK